MDLRLRGTLLHRIIPTRIVSRQYRSAPSAITTQTQPTRRPTPEQPPLPPRPSPGNPVSLPDHRRLATEQELFFSSPASPGSPLFLPNGSRIFHKLQEFLRAQYAYYGFQEIVSPTIFKKSLWEQSGHWDRYSQDMFIVTGRGASGGAKETLEIGEEEEYGLKPMNCPGHCLIFKSSTKSHRDLPVRYADFSPLHRNEVSGSLSGLTRVRRFHQDDAHIFCRPSQISSEITSTLEFINTAYKVFRLPEHKLVLSTRPENHIGEISEWDRAEAALREALNASGKEWSTNERDGAFYGPKIDIILKDSDGKEHQTATIQLDFQLPARFGLVYQMPAPELEEKVLEATTPAETGKSGLAAPVIIHRAIFGSLERFMALLIEHYNGRWPFWLSPRQAIVIPVVNTNELVAYAKGVQRTVSGVEGPTPASSSATAAQPLGRRAFVVDIDTSGKSLSKKIQEARSMKYNHVIVVGESNLKSGTVTVSSRVDEVPPDGAVQKPVGKELLAPEVYAMFVNLEKQYR
ncbi:class II aaRS and biotin synthetase [Terfezia boudieri ATCC MYA-4762]|uniref:threonine--tRNA ligase n=1 Tax=Terfezia boudieri ATCC MYA-4762 TaxID=1051890 RepID=A0A3N4LH60_9PEZI|nr:class II aaRS and biotin synthetase [Terfezia boudieri ATCC MYA-4762]